MNYSSVVNVAARKTRSLRGKARKFVRSEAYAAGLALPIRQGVVFYESFSGNGMLCNPEAIFRYLLESREFAHLKHVWTLASFDEYREVIERFRDEPRVSFVEQESPQYFGALARAEYVINNSTFPWAFSKRKGQTYVNTWHGTPLKLMGYDVPGGGPDTRNIIRNFVQADYLVSPNSFTTEQMYYAAYKLRNIFEGRILEAGYPRIDRQWLSDQAKRDVWDELAVRGIPDDGRQVVLYAPTWKGKSFYSPANDAQSLLSTVQRLETELDATKYRVLLKIHQRVYEAAKDTPGLSKYLVPNGLPTNQVLGLASILITDYSSVFYDFLATRRPIVFYTPDAEEYRDGRGLYRDLMDLPGPVAANDGELARHVNESCQNLEAGKDGTVLESYEEDVRRFVPMDDGKATERVVREVFGKAHGSEHVRNDHSDGREKILVYAGGLMSNGITTSFLNLMDNIDHEKYDVSVWYSYTRKAERVANALKINENVRLFPRTGAPNLSIGQRMVYRRTLDHGLKPGTDFKTGSRQIWDDEWNRCFGASKFDYIVDFSGYAPFWSLVLLRGNAKKHSIWMHNDLYADAHKVVDGRQPHLRNLTSLFSTYSSFDRVVSVSEELASLNARKLSKFADRRHFVAARNSVAHDKVKASVSQIRPPKPESLEEQFDAFYDERARDLGSIVRGIRGLYSDATIDSELAHQRVLETYFAPTAGEKVSTFVSVGRFSPEKNQSRLIRAFALVHAARPDTRLLLIGSGPLEKKLRSLVSDLRLEEAVQFTGQLPNPYILMEAADCFVLSSDYEGQPMVILEAKMLGLPIVTTAFGSVRSAVPEGTGKVVDLTDEALAEGMIEFLDGGVKAVDFDVDEYNRSAMEEFYRAIGASQ